MATEGMWAPDEPDHELTFGLERVLDGVGVLIGSRARERGTEASGTGPDGV